MGGDFLSGLFQVILFLIVFGSVLFLVFITTRFVGGRAAKSMRGKHIHIVETVNIGMDKKLHLVKAGGQFILLASSGKRLEYLTEIRLEDDGEEDSPVAPDTGGFDFKAFFEKYIQLYKQKKDNGLERQRNLPENKAAGGEVFKKNLGRLKDITRVMGHDGGKVGEDDSTNEK